MRVTLVSRPASTIQSVFLYNMNPAVMIVATKSEESHNNDELIVIWGPADRLSVLKTSSNPILVVLAQFASLTSGTSLGSAKVMSTHYRGFRSTCERLGWDSSTHII